MDPRKRIILALCLVLFFLAIGTAGYAAIDGYSLIDAFYMTVITISTVGYGEIQELSSTGRIFTVFLILSGVGCLAFAAGAFTEIVIERAANPNSRKKAMEKKISRLENHVIICGHGRVGAAAALYFKEIGTDFVVIEKSEEYKSRLEELGIYFLNGDGTREETLLKAGIKKASGVLAVLDSDPGNLFAVLTARELNPVLKIIARIDHPNSEKRMLRAGADSVISPYVAAGQKVAESFVSGVEVKPEADLTSVSHHVPKWQEVTDDSTLIGKSIQTIYSIDDSTVLGLRRGEIDTLLPAAYEVIEKGDLLLLLQSQKKDNLAADTGQKMKIILVDDNPVITRLYTRLFQKAGFITKSAATGAAGFNLIRDEKPDAAVVDFHLPDMTGLEVCSNLRRESQYDPVKLFLFTADEQKETRLLATEAGVDKVVLKSPEAGEIVAQVSEYLQ